MKLTLILTCLPALLLACRATEGAQPDLPNHLSAAEREAGWELLFDGESTAGWRTYMTDGVSDGWEVVDGALTLTGAGGDLITEEQYESFELQLEWRIEPVGNSGIMFHVVEGYPAAYMSGPEMQVLDDAAHGEGLDPLHAAGSCYGLYAPQQDATRPAGEWNETRLLVDRGYVEHWLNGVKLLEYRIGSPDWAERVAESKFSEWELFGVPTRGHIALQDHGNRVAYRDIALREL